MNEHGVDVHQEEVLEFDKLGFEYTCDQVLMIHDGRKFRFEVVSFTCKIRFVKSGSHYCNDHVQNDQKLDQSAKEEYQPKDDLIWRIREFICNLEVTESQSVRVDQ